MQAGIPRTTRKLEEELQRLQCLCDSGYNLRIRWMPRTDSTLEGEVKGDVVFIYSEREEYAVQTLKHEFLDFLVSQAVEPYRELVNAQRLVITGLLNSLEEKVYQSKESLVGRLELVLDALESKRGSGQDNCR